MGKKRKKNTRIVCREPSRSFHSMQVILVLDMDCGILSIPGVTQKDIGPVVMSHSGTQRVACCACLLTVASVVLTSHRSHTRPAKARLCCHLTSQIPTVLAEGKGWRSNEPRIGSGCQSLLRFIDPTQNRCTSIRA